MDDKLEEKIIQGLEALENGQTLEQVLRLFPDDADSLRPALEVAVMLSDVRVAHSLQAQSKSRQRFLERAATLQEGPKEAKFVLGFWRRLFAPLAAVAAIILILSAGTFAASQSALPGDALYGAKRTFEGIQLSLIRDLQAQQMLQQEFQEERLREIRELVAIGRQAEVILEGEIESISGDNWVVAGIPVEITDDTTIDGSPAVGVEVQIEGETTFDKVKAEEVIVSLVDLPAPEPTSIPSPTMQPPDNDNTDEMPDDNMGPTGEQPEVLTATPTPSRTPSPTPTATATATATATSTRRATATPTTTATASSMATATATDTPAPPPPTSTPPPPTSTPPPPTSTSAPPTSTPAPSPTDDNGNDNDNDNDNNNNNNNNNNDNDNDNNNSNDNDNNSGPGGGGATAGALTMLALPTGLFRRYFFKRSF